MRWRRPFPTIPQAISNTLKIAEMCDVTIETGVYHFPNVEPAGEQKPGRALRGALPRGFREEDEEGCRRPTRTSPTSCGRSTRRDSPTRWTSSRRPVLRAIFSSSPISSAMRNRTTYRSGRAGARPRAASSPSALDITNIDPIRWDLLFERFLNPERISMPDIDVDFCFEKRERVIEYVTQQVRQGQRRPDHHLRHDEIEGGRQGRGKGPRPPLRKRRPDRKADTRDARYQHRAGHGRGAEAQGAYTRRTRRSRS